jgi:hypothetical protein
MTERDQPRAKPTNYDELFPGRFLKAGLLLGQTPTYTIKDIELESLPQEDGKNRDRGIVSFCETQLGLVLNSTNGQCLKAMWGPAVRAWIGKRVTLCTEKDRDPCGKGMVDATRILGSPDIESDLTVEIKMPRRKPRTRTLRRTGAAKNAHQGQQTHAQPRKPRGDIEDAESRLRLAPPEEIPAIFESLREFSWNSEEICRIAKLKPQQPTEPNPDNDGRDT